jgi:hypothetical protein
LCHDVDALVEYEWKVSEKKAQRHKAAAAQGNQSSQSEGFGQ